jgi:hypothetical protein
MKYDWNDISIVPESLSDISSRKEIDPTWSGKLPLFTAPMDKVIDETNVSDFVKNNINICLPRHVKYDVLKNEDYFYSYGLDEIIDLLNNKSQLPKRVLIDVANGHMLKLWQTAKLIKEEFGDKVELMVGNIANPDTYRKYCEIGVDYIRVGIGGGSGTSYFNQYYHNSNPAISSISSGKGSGGVGGINGDHGQINIYNCAQGVSCSPTTYNFNASTQYFNYSVLASGTIRYEIIGGGGGGGGSSCGGSSVTAGANGANGSKVTGVFKNISSRLVISIGR